MLKLHQKTIYEALGRRPIHPFPARMAPGIALDALGECDTPFRVLDPMVGSGTVLAVARANGHHGFGVDLDPLAVLLAKVWTRTVQPQQIKEAAADILRTAKSAFATMRTAEAYPQGSDDSTRKFIRFWFDDYARRQLTALSNAINLVHNKRTRDVLWCGFSRLIITKTAGASLAMDLSHSRPHRKFERAPIKPFNAFIKAVKTVVDNCPQTSRGRVGPPTVIKHGDGRDLGIPDESMDLVLTSPPYLNAIDYIRCSKFSLVWMGYNIDALRKVRGESIGAEAALSEALEASWVQSIIKRLRLSPALSPRNQALLARYVWDMGRALDEATRVLRPNGRAVYVVGDSTIRGTFIRNSSVVRMVAENAGLAHKSRHSRVLPANRRYMPPPKQTDGNLASMDGRMRKEVVLEFRKPAA